MSMVIDSPALIISTYQALLAELEIRVNRVLDRDSRCIVAIAGPPAAGKSTLTQQLISEISTDNNWPEAALVPMDGYHLDNIQLNNAGTLDRKGAPHTFDIGGLHSLLSRLRTNETPIYAPEFDRVSDLSRNSAIRIEAEHKLIIVEGNYLLLNAVDWKELDVFFDLSILIDVPEAMLKKRLVQRWLEHGLSESDAIARAELNDLPNAITVIRQSTAPSILYRPDVSEHI